MVQIFLSVLQFSLVTLFPTVLKNHLQLNVALTSMKNGGARNLPNTIRAALSTKVLACFY